jgi:hypothetical protein
LDSLDETGASGSFWLTRSIAASFAATRRKIAPLQTWDVQCNQLCGAQWGAPLTDLREIGILQSFPGWPEPNAA